jgi:cell division protein FtsI (penicillin-binding protein 3)
MGAKDGIFILKKRNLDVTIEGRGSITRQSIAPGTPIEKGAKIKITLE